MDLLQSIAVGFGTALTEELSRECAVDLHALIELSSSSAAVLRRLRPASWRRSTTKGARVEHLDC